MPSAYKQAFVVTMADGAVILAVVEGSSPRRGEHAAQMAACNITDVCGPVWDVAAYPTTSDLPLGTRRMT